MMKRCNWRLSATTWFKRQGTVALLAAAGLGAVSSPALADVVGIGDITPFIVVDGEKVPNLPQFGGTVTGGALVVGGTGQNIGGTAAGQMTIDIPSDTDPLVSDTGVIGGNTFGLGLVRIVSLNSQWTINDQLVVGQQGQGFLELVSGARLFTDPEQENTNSAFYDLILGDVAGSQGFAVVDGFGSLMVNTRVSVGYEGFGDVQILNSARMETWQTASIGTEVFETENGLGQGYVLVDGIGSRWNVGVFPTPTAPNANMDLLIGDEGRGTLEITNQGRVRVGRDTFIGEEIGSYGEAIVTGRNSLLWTFENMVVGRSAGNSTGVVNINDKAMVRNDVATTINRLGTINLNDGTLLTPLVTNNDGVIRGAGTIDAASVINNGDIRNAASVANLRERLLVTGTVTNSVGSIIESLGGEMEFQGLVTNNGQIFGRDAIFRFRAGVAGAGGEMFIGNSTIESPLPLTVASLTVDDSGSSTVIGDLTLSGNLNMEIGYTFSKLFVTGDANLGGALNITLGSGFTPYFGQRWEIIAAGDVNGAFASVNAPPIPGINWGVQTIGNSAFLTTNFIATPGTGADFNGDGIVNGDDLAIWQANVGLGTNPPPPATQAQGDANGDGVVDGADFLLIQQKFGGPPAVPATAAVPEPSSVLLALAAFGLPLAARRRRS